MANEPLSEQPLYVRLTEAITANLAHKTTLPAILALMDEWATACVKAKKLVKGERIAEELPDGHRDKPE